MSVWECSVEQFQSCRVVNHDFDWIKATYARCYIVYFFLCVRHRTRCAYRKSTFCVLLIRQWKRALHTLGMSVCVWIACVKCVLMPKYSCCQLTGIHPYIHALLPPPSLYSLGFCLCAHWILPTPPVPTHASSAAISCHNQVNQCHVPPGWRCR